MTRVLRAALAGVWVFAVACGGAGPSALPASTGASQGPPTGAAVESPTPPVDTPAATLALATFTSPLHGFSFDFPAAWVPREASKPWPQGAYVEPEELYVDSVFPAGHQLGVSAGIAAQPLAKGLTAASWFEALARERDVDSTACDYPPAAWTDAMVGGVAARRIEARCSVATGAPFDGIVLDVAWVIGGTGYVATGTPSIVEIMVASFRPSA